MSDGSTLLTEGGEAPAQAPISPQPEATHAEPSTPKAAPSEGRIFLHTFEGQEWATDPSLTRFADDDGSIDAATLAKSYVHAQSLVGKDKIVLPEEGNDEQWAEVYDRLGRPESPDAYELPRPEVPEGVNVEYNEDTEKHFREVVHGLGLNSTQAKKAYEALIQQRLEEAGAYQQLQAKGREEAINALRREQGANFDGFVNQAKTAMRAYADPDYIQYLEESGQGNDPRVIRMWAKVGKEMMGDTRLQGEGSQPTPADVQREIDTYIEKYGAAIDNPDHPDFKKHRSNLDRLYQRLYPEPAA